MKDLPTRWVFISDLQVGQANGHEESVRRLVEQAAEERPDFVINGGDHIHGAVKAGAEERRNVKKMWADYQNIIAPLQKLCPVISTIGNHDQTGAAVSSAEFVRQTGRLGQANYYARTIGGVHIVNLDVVAARHRGGFTDRAQARWLRRHLRRPRQARCTVAVGHYPIVLASCLYESADPSLLYNEKTGAQGDLLPLLLDARVDLYLCGHLHAYQRDRYKTLTQVMASASYLFIEEMRDKPGKQTRAFDERQNYVRFALSGSTIRAEAVAIDGDVIDRWTQKLTAKREP